MGQTVHGPSYSPPQRLDLDDRLNSLKVIHIAGTKGKGSTAAFVESMLRHSGYSTGLFTSPHLMDVRERIRINGYGGTDLGMGFGLRCCSEHRDYLA